MPKNDDITFWKNMSLGRRDVVIKSLGPAPKGTVEQDHQECVMAQISPSALTLPTRLLKEEAHLSYCSTVVDFELVGSRMRHRLVAILPSNLGL
jgi:hypothetical protein